MKASQSEIVRRKVKKLNVGEVVTANDFPAIPRSTVSQILGRLSDEGLLVRVKRGVYSRCKESNFGLVKPSPLMILSQEVENDDNKCFGGLFLLNQLGLTSQVPTTIEILNNKSRYQIKIDATKVQYTTIRPKIDKKTKPHIMILEVLKKIKKIPDGDMRRTFQWIYDNLITLDKKSLQLLANTALDYIPRVRAILGNLLQSIDRGTSDKLKKTLKQNTSFKVGEIVNYLDNVDEWNLEE